MGTSSKTQEPVGESNEETSAASEDVWMSLACQRQAMAGRVDAWGSKSQVEMANAVLEQEVQSALRAISHLRHQQNLLLPVARLPVELLLRVFVELKEMLPVDAQDARPPAETWLTVTCICRTWRSAALDFASLWTNVPLHLGEQWAQAYIARSKLAALSLPVLDHLTVPSWQETLVRGEVSRIRNLELNGDVYSLLVAVDILIDRIPTQLVKIALNPSSHITLDSGTSRLFTRVPQLRAISFGNMSMEWEVLRWASLRSVRVDFGLHERAAEGFTQLIASLKSATALEFLHLNALDVPFIANAPPQSTVTHLSRLQHLTLFGNVDKFHRLFNAITTPASSTISMILHAEDTDTIDPSILSPLLLARRQQNQQTSSDCIQAMRLSSFGPSEFVVTMEAWKASKLFEEQRGRSSILISLRLPTPTDGKTHRELAAMCNDIGLGSLRELELSLKTTAGEVWTVEIFHALFSSARHVERVRIAGHRHVSQFFDALSTPMSDVASNADPNEAPAMLYSRASVMFPSLSHIYLTQGDGTYINYLSIPGSIRVRAMYAPVKVLGISECSIHDDTIRVLENIAGLKLEWDGLHGASPDENVDEN